MISIICQMTLYVTHTHTCRYLQPQVGQQLTRSLQREMDRLELQHLLWMELLGGRLHLAPLQKINVTHALDVGCGTGSMQPSFFFRYYLFHLLFCAFIPELS